MHTFQIREEDRQLILLGLAILSLQRPGFECACREASKCLGGSNGEELLDGFRDANSDTVKRIYMSPQEQQSIDTKPVG